MRGYGARKDGRAVGLVVDEERDAQGLIDDTKEKKKAWEKVVEETGKHKDGKASLAVG